MGSPVLPQGRTEENTAFRLQQACDELEGDYEDEGGEVEGCAADSDGWDDGANRSEDRFDHARPRIVDLPDGMIPGHSAEHHDVGQHDPCQHGKRKQLDIANGGCPLQLGLPKSPIRASRSCSPTPSEDPAGVTRITP